MQKTKIKAEIILDSTSPAGSRLTTMRLTYPRFIHSEFMTHRAFSRNAASSRAIPISRTISQVIRDPAHPIHWGANKTGMQADSELQSAPRKLAIALWLGLRYVACVIAWLLAKIGLHKQVANRLLEPWIWIEVVVSSTEWQNFFDQRDHSMAQPEIHELARRMRAELEGSIPAVIPFGKWHLPFIDRAELAVYGIDTLKKVSVARCAGVSYGRFDIRSIEKDLELFDRLAANHPPHLSPLEHVATPMTELQRGNLIGWAQLRVQYEIRRIDR
jgi:hypothetical protein